MHTSVTNWLPFFSTNGSEFLIWGRRLSKLLLCELPSSTWYFLVSLFVQKRPQKYRKNGISNKSELLKCLCSNSSVNNVSRISVSMLTTEDYPLFNHVAGKILRTVKPMTVTLEKWWPLYKYIQVSFQFNLILSSFNACSSPIRLPWKG